MNTSNEERFHELAHKALAKEAQAAERAELQALIAENPKLEEEFEQMGAASAAVREILPLLEDIEPPQGSIPPPPMARLQEAVREVFEPPKESVGELWELLVRLEQWTRRLVGAERERLKVLIAALRESASAQGGAPAARGMAMEPVYLMQVPKAPALMRDEALACAPPSEREEASAKEKELEDRLRVLQTLVRQTEEITHERHNAEEEELESRLRALEARIERAEQITHECRDEVRGLLVAFARRRKAKP